MTLRDFKEQYMLYGKPHYRDTLLKNGEIVLDETSSDNYFGISDLQGDLEISKEALLARFQLLGVMPETTQQIFPNLNINDNPSEIVLLPKAKVVKALRDLLIYEDEIYEQFSDVIPDVYRRIQSLTRKDE